MWMAIFQTLIANLFFVTLAGYILFKISKKFFFLIIDIRYES